MLVSTVTPMTSGRGRPSAAAAVVALPGATLPEVAQPALKPAPENGGGYSLSEHVKRYYKTTLV